MALDPNLTRPIVGIENRTAQEVFDIMCDRFTAYLQHAGEAEPVGYITEAALELMATAKPGWHYHMFAKGQSDPEATIPLFAAPHPHQAPEGWVLVPIEPTPEMCAADAGTSTTDRLAWNAAMYRAMIAASPSNQASASADQGGE